MGVLGILAENEAANLVGHRIPAWEKASEFRLGKVKLVAGNHPVGYILSGAVLGIWLGIFPVPGLRQMVSYHILPLKTRKGRVNFL